MLSYSKIIKQIERRKISNKSAWENAIALLATFEYSWRETFEFRIDVDFVDAFKDDVVIQGLEKDRVFPFVVKSYFSLNNCLRLLLVMLSSAKF